MYALRCERCKVNCSSRVREERGGVARADSAAHDLVRVPLHRQLAVRLFDLVLGGLPAHAQRLRAPRDSSAERAPCRSDSASRTRTARRHARRRPRAPTHPIVVGRHRAAICALTSPAASSTCRPAGVLQKCPSKVLFFLDPSSWQTGRTFPGRMVGATL